MFVTRAIPAVGGREEDIFAALERAPKEETTPEEYRPRMGKITATKSIPELKTFMEAGGTVVTIGTSTEMTASGQERPLPGEKYYIPGSVLQVTLDSTQHATWGMSNQTDVYFDASPVFKLAPEAIAKGTVVPLAWFDTGKPLRSGWAWGQSYLQDGVAAFMAPVGSGKFYAFGPEITFRAQAQGTFKMLFNQLYNVGSTPSSGNGHVADE